MEPSWWLSPAMLEAPQAEHMPGLSVKHPTRRDVSPNTPRGGTWGPYRDLVAGQRAGCSLCRVVCFLRQPDLLLQPARERRVVGGAAGADDSTGEPVTPGMAQTSHPHACSLRWHL